MEKLFYILLFLLMLTNIAFADIVNAQESTSTFKPATYLDTSATYDVPDNWVYEGVIFNEDYSQKKYTYIKNLDVSVLYGMRDLKEEIRKKMPFVSAESMLNSLSEESIVDIIGSASKSDVEQKIYGENVFYEFNKIQESNENGKSITVYCIVDMMIKDGNIFSFSYIYKDKKDAITDYGKMLTSFKITNEDESSNVISTPTIIEETPTPVVETTPTPTQEDQTTVETPIVENTPLPENIENNNEEENIVAQNPTDIQESAEIIALSGNSEISTSGNARTEVNTNKKTEEELFEEMGVVKQKYEKKSFLQTILLIVSRNPVLCILLVFFIILDIAVIIIKKKKYSNNDKK